MWVLFSSRTQRSELVDSWFRFWSIAADSNQGSTPNRQEKAVRVLTCFVSFWLLAWQQLARTQVPRTYWIAGVQRELAKTTSRNRAGRLSSAVVLSGRMRETTGCSYAFDVAMTTTRVLTGSRLNQEIDGCWDSRTLAAAATPEKGFQILNKIKERNVACIYTR